MKTPKDHKLAMDEDTIPPMATGSKNTPLKSELSYASKQYDTGNKGYLDTEEQIIRKYDTDNDGIFTLEEAKQMARDLRSAIVSKEMYRKIIFACGALLVISWAGNFGLIWSTVALTRKLDTQGGDLTDTSGNRIATKPKGNLVGFQENGNLESDLNHLEEHEVALYGTLLKTKSEVQGLYADFASDVTVSVNQTTFDGDTGTTTTHVWKVNRVGSQSIVDTCDIYGNVEIVGSDEYFEARCCGAEDDLCDVYVSVVSGRKLLDVCSFSPKSTVIERTKGKMLLKDLDVGKDSILAADGTYQPVVLWIHHSPLAATFLQIHTSASDEATNDAAPIEATGSHFIFVEGHELPVLARNIKVGDSLVGVDATQKVTKINSVRRAGFFSPLTADATLVVDGILFSSMSDVSTHVTTEVADPNNLNFGLFKVHTHTFMSRFVAPMAHFVCTRISPFVCEAQSHDDSDGSMAILIEAGATVLNMPPLYQGLTLIVVPAFGVVSLVAYRLLMALVPIVFVLGAILLAQKGQQLTKEKVV